MSIVRALLWLACAACGTSAWAIDFRSLAEPAIMYDAPSKQSKPRFVIARHTPVELVVSVEGWSKVRDSAGDIAWVERKVLSEKRTVMVTAERAQARASADAQAALVFEADKGVVLELVEPGPTGWVKVRHREGQSGYARVIELWGL